MLNPFSPKFNQGLEKAPKLAIFFTKALIFSTIGEFILLAFFMNIANDKEQQFWFLADSFINGRLYITHMPDNRWFDFAFYNGHYYWPLGPFPAVTMIPFVLLSKISGIFLYQGFLQFFLTIGTIFLCFKIARIYKFSKEHSLLLAFAFCFSSVYVIVAFLSWGWYFAQAISVFLIFFSIYEFLTKKRYWLIGLIYGLILATRFTAGIGILFFILELFLNKRMHFEDIKKSFIMLIIPYLIIGSTVLLYNNARFGNIFESGNIKVNNAVFSEKERYEVLNYGLFQLRNIPTNFYYYFIKSLDPIKTDVKFLQHENYVLQFPYVTVGYPSTSFFIISPIFLFLLKTRFKDKIVRISFITMFVILFLLLSWYWPGWRQIGPRYMLDLLPFAFIPLLLSFKNKKLPIKAQFLIFVSALFNLYLFSSILIR